MIPVCMDVMRVLMRYTVPYRTVPYRTVPYRTKIVRRVGHTNFTSTGYPANTKEVSMHSHPPVMHSEHILHPEQQWPNARRQRTSRHNRDGNRMDMRILAAGDHAKIVTKLKRTPLILNILCARIFMLRSECSVAEAYLEGCLTHSSSCFHAYVDV
jgi:hypothetical protein